MREVEAEGISKSILKKSKIELKKDINYALEKVFFFAKM